MYTELSRMHTEPLRTHTERLSIYTELSRMHTELLRMYAEGQGDIKTNLSIKKGEPTSNFDSPPGFRYQTAILLPWPHIPDEVLPITFVADR